MGFNGLGHDQHFTVGPNSDITLSVWWGSSIDEGFGDDQGAQYIAGNAVHTDPGPGPQGAGGRLDIVSQGKEVDFFGFVRYWVTLHNSSEFPVWVDLQGGGF